MTARRRARVECEWTAELIEAPDADPDYPWCHAATRRVEVLSASSGDPHEHVAREAARARWHKKTPTKQPKR
jgi:hypothetical protein